MAETSGTPHADPTKDRSDLKAMAIFLAMTAFAVAAFVASLVIDIVPD